MYKGSMCRSGLHFHCGQDNCNCRCHNMKIRLKGSPRREYLTKESPCLSIDFLQRCESIARAFEGKGQKWNMHYQLLHIYDEVNEVQKAFANGDLDNFKEECCDVILTSLTALHMLGVNPEDIQEAMEEKLDRVEHRCGIKEY